ncbi:MAG TPA: hypothetical protein VNW97_09350 [Candidatus Saccharimonadales bacterium]|jgi:hypothetical protein|nr:hypothetical protein [Candidatus Saccharimonadales bacterium]
MMDDMMISQVHRRNISSISMTGIKRNTMQAVVQSVFVLVFNPALFLAGPPATAKIYPAV